MQSYLNYIFNCSTTALFYIFCCSTFCSSFLPLIPLSPSLLFSMLIFSCLLLCLFQSPRFRLSAVLFCRMCCCNYFCLLFYNLLDFSFFIAILYVMIQHQCCISHSLFCRPYSCFDQYPSGSLNIRLKPFLVFSPFLLFLPFSGIPVFLYQVLVLV